MTPMRTLLLILCVALITAVPAAGQISGERTHDETIAASRAGTGESIEIARDLARARRAGDGARVEELERLLFARVETMPDADHPAVIPAPAGEPPARETVPAWGNDVKIYSGAMYSYGRRQLAIDCDTLGGIYVALNAKYQDTLSVVRIYKSTNGGSTWSFLFSFYSPGLALQSFDMCVTDTTGGKFILGFALIVKTDKTANGGGILYWTSVLSDGSHFRSKIIASATSAIAFKNPSICTDGQNYSNAYFFVAAEYTNPARDSTRGLWITRSTDWGKNWSAPDTSLRGYTEGTPTIVVDWSTTPDSLCVAFSRFTAPNRRIRVARSGKTLTTPWTITYPAASKEEFDPSLALDPVRGNALVTFTRNTGAPTYYDAMYYRSTDLFKTFVLDSIATSTANEELTSVSYAPWSSGYYWRAAYRSSAGGDTIYYKAMLNSLSTFYGTAPRAVSQFRPTTSVIPVVGYDRDPGGTSYRGNVVYVGYGPQDVYFDAVDLTLDVPFAGEMPVGFALAQNYPNPFNPTTVIRGQWGEAAEITLTVFDLLGREVAVIARGQYPAGQQTFTFDASTLASGVYLYRLEARGARSSWVDVKKMIFMR